MNHYRLSFIESLGAPSPTPSPPPRRRVQLGTEQDVFVARKDRVQRLHLVLLMEAGVPFIMLPGGAIDIERQRDADLVEQLWNDANVLVQCGRDLQ